MSVQITCVGSTLEMRVSGKLTDDDYTHPETGIVAEMGRYAASHDHMQILCVLTNFHGWEGGSEDNEMTLWGQIKHKQGRCAIVGADGLMQSSMKFMSLFVHQPQVKCFTDEADGLRWVKDESDVAAA